MSVRLEIKLAIFILIAVQLVTSFGAIALLGSRSDDAMAAAGAWSMVLLTLIGFSVSTVVLRRLMVRVAAPLAQIDEALQGFGQGDSFRRPKLTAAPVDLERIAASVSSLMDPRIADNDDPRETAAADRAALLHFLDAMGSPTVVVNRRGTVTALSASALSKLEADQTGAVKNSLKAAALGKPAPCVASVTPIAQNSLFLCSLK